MACIYNEKKTVHFIERNDKPANYLIALLITTKYFIASI